MALFNDRHTYRPYQSPTTYAVSLTQDQARGPPLPLAFLKPATNDNNLTSKIL
ncbi:hypothetical protein K443DRAFT_632094 [Laccaria amethystina LaAM-08-1]|uniref:Uncharacterized protein n=1 Tax=Laccaria amethystina LaAM-08-1 TaxID=1095629 RepID=A0A0C9XIB4_9AGAR|nr:hypothetical protein K443DRAFT_632094 [Laccaria amethystina LaAM-08-1]